MAFSSDTYIWLINTTGPSLTSVWPISEYFWDSGITLLAWLARSCTRGLGMSVFLVLVLPPHAPEQASSLGGPPKNSGQMPGQSRLMNKRWTFFAGWRWKTERVASDKAGRSDWFDLVTSYGMTSKIQTPIQCSLTIKSVLNINELLLDRNLSFYLMKITLWEWLFLIEIKSTSELWMAELCM